MKKSLLALFLCLTMPLNMVAQKGMQSIGVNVPVDIRKQNVSIGFGIKYQYNFTDHFRMELAGSYSPVHSYSTYSDHRNTSWRSYEIEYAHVIWQGHINAHIFLVSPKTIRPYLILGAGVSSYEAKKSWGSYNTTYNANTVYYEYEKMTPIDANAGLGLDIRMHYRWSLQLSALAVKPFFTDNLVGTGFYSGEVNGQFNVGVTYNF